MAARKNKVPKIGNDPVPKPETAKPTFTSSNGVALSLPTVEGCKLVLSYWDLWFAIVASRDDGGDLRRLADRLKTRERSYSFDRRAVERKRWHLRDLDGRLAEAGLGVKDVMTAAGSLAKSELRRALKRVLENGEREWSEPMRNTPRKRRSEHALRGYWGLFPVLPEPYEKKIGAHFQSKDFYAESMSFKIARTLDGYAEKATRMVELGKSAEAQALLRGWMVVILDLMERADDSSGSIGMSFGEGFTAYLNIPAERTGIDESVYFPDLLDFLIWED